MFVCTTTCERFLVELVLGRVSGSDEGVFDTGSIEELVVELAREVLGYLIRNFQI